MSITVTVDPAQMQSVRDALAHIKGGYARAASRALNRTASGAKTIATQELSNVITAAQKYIRDALIVSKATQANLQSVLTITGKPIPLIAFKARQTASGATYQVFTGAGRSGLRHAFIATMPSGHQGVWLRRKVGGKYAGRLPIEERYGPNPATLFERTPELGSKIEEQSADRLLRELDHETDWLLQKIPEPTDNG